jgi:hypothetical protein
MSAVKGLVDVHQTVGYNPPEKTLVVTLTSKMANTMRAHGWDIAFNSEVGYFITIKKE